MHRPRQRSGPDAGRRWRLGVGLALGGWLLVVAAAGAATTVGDGTPASCTEAALNMVLLEGGRINFDCGPAPVTIELTRPLVPLSGTTLNGGGLVTLSGGDTDRLFRVGEGVTVTLLNLTLRDGGNVDFAGAIFNQGTLTIRNSTLTDNTASGDILAVGGAIFNQDTLTISNSTLAENTAESDSVAVGGAILNDGTLTIRNSILAENTAESDGVAEGGAIFNRGTLTLTRVTFRNNTPDDCNGTGCPAP
jgi:hypothetical protein